jgi:LytS/YehU family sensor histidine kinase
VLKIQNKEVVNIKDEITFAKKYCFLQQSRFGKNLSVHFDISEKFYNNAIPPLSMQMLIENAIKHNIISAEHPLNIHIFVQGDAYLVIENNLQNKEAVDKSTGLGLANIKNRYSFLTNSEILVSQKEGIFRVALPLLIHET